MIDEQHRRKTISSEAFKRQESPFAQDIDTRCKVDLNIVASACHRTADTRLWMFPPRWSSAPSPRCPSDPGCPWSASTDSSPSWRSFDSAWRSRSRVEEGSSTCHGLVARNHLFSVKWKRLCHWRPPASSGQLCSRPACCSLCLSNCLEEEISANRYTWIVRIPVRGEFRWHTRRDDRCLGWSDVGAHSGSRSSPSFDPSSSAERQLHRAPSGVECIGTHASKQRFSKCPSGISTPHLAARVPPVVSSNLDDCCSRSFPHRAV